MELNCNKKAYFSRSAFNKVKKENMCLLKDAIIHYSNKEYEKAKELFQIAGDRYGKNVVAANIYFCNKALNANHAVIADSFSKEKSYINSRLDPATILMLHQNGDIVLDDDQKNECILLYNKLTERKSEDADVKKIDPIPADWPTDLILSPIPESTNDFYWYLGRKARKNNKYSQIGLSVIVPTFNRSRILDITLACLVNQETEYPFEIVVADDGSKEAVIDIVKKYESIIDIKYIRQKDYGYQLCAVRNLGLRAAKYEFVAILDCDMAPNIKWVQSYMELLVENDDLALIGPRKYVDTNGLSASSFLDDKNLIELLPEVKTNNNVAGKDIESISVDWRLEHFNHTQNLRLCDTPFRYFSGGNVAFSRKWLNKAGWFDEEFTQWGGEDNEFGYRLYRQGCFFQAVAGGIAYHQEPPGKENETDRAAGKKVTVNLVHEKVPYFYRKYESDEKFKMYNVPLVSIYIPAYNCENYIVRCVESALNQTITDLEVCICNDGSTDNTLDVLYDAFGNNPRVHIIDKKNGGIGSASNTAVRMARGFYVGQLDSDDYLEPDAVELCLKEFLSDRSLVCVYTTNRNIKPDGSIIAKGYNWPHYSREKILTTMIIHHFRMFTIRSWNLTDGFDEQMSNAIDYDMFLKLSEVGKFKHINKICYNRLLHGENTSIKNLSIQKKNHFLAVNNSLKRQGINCYTYIPKEDGDGSRKYIYQHC